jgi:hypothetical protein
MNNLAIDNLTILFAVGGVILLLTLLQLSLAINQDKRETNAGPIKELDEIKAELRSKEAQKLDFEAEIEKFRKTLAEQADSMAQADSLQRRIEELQTEWNSLSGKRSELSEFLIESETSQVKRAEIEASLRIAQSELLEIKDKLVDRDDLDNKIEALKLSKTELEEDLRRLRDEVSELKQVIADTDRMRKEVEQLSSDVARIEGTKLARQAELDSLSKQAESINMQLAELKNDQAQIFAKIEAETIELNSVRKEKDHLTAEIETLKVLAQQKQKKLGGPDVNPDKDPLAELKVHPPVIKELMSLDEAEFEDETDALKNVKKTFKAVGLQYHDRVLNAFHTTMKTNETTQMAVLAGISGTGKSQLPRQYAAGMGIGFLQIPVQPRWDSPQDLMGFYNYIENAFKPTDMAQALWALDTENNFDNPVRDRMLMIMLDEMNLARVEYYFSDFLSRLESRPSKELVQQSDKRRNAEIELEIPDNNNETVRLFPGYNLLFAGTMNEDETTQSLSDKVIDRANVLRFGAPETLFDTNETGTIPELHALSSKRWERWVRNISTLQTDAPLVDNSIKKMSELMKEFGKPFAHRLGGAIKNYVANYPETEGMDRIRVSLADQVEMRLLPKLRGVDVDEYSAQFGQLQSFVQDEFNDTKLSEAIGRSVELSQRNSQFTWSGVTR